MKIKILTFALILFGMNLFAQNVESHEKKHYKNDIGIANAAVYLLGEKEFTYGLGAHYIRNIKNSDFGIGIAFDKILGEHNHNTIGVIFRYKPIKDLIINLSPGIIFEHKEAKFGMHLETSYVLDIYAFHIGPMLSFASDLDEAHLGLGLHLGYGF